MKKPIKAVYITGKTKKKIRIVSFKNLETLKKSLEKKRKKRR